MRAKAQTGRGSAHRQACVQTQRHRVAAFGESRRVCGSTGRWSVVRRIPWTSQPQLRISGRPVGVPGPRPYRQAGERSLRTKGLRLDADNQAREKGSWLTTMGSPCLEIKQRKRWSLLACVAKSVSRVSSSTISRAGAGRRGVGSRAQWMAQGA